MRPTLADLQQISIFAALSEPQLAALCAHATVRQYAQGEIINQEGESLPACLYALVSGMARVSKTSVTGKETILRSLTAGDLFAAPALFGDGRSPATVTAEGVCRVLMVERESLLAAIQATPEIAMNWLQVFNQRLQQLHNTVHGLVSERAVVRLARYIQYVATEQGTVSSPQGLRLHTALSHYQIARSIGITYEECVRLFKQLHTVLAYHRGGQITVLDWAQLDAIAAGAPEHPH